MVNSLSMPSQITNTTFAVTIDCWGQNPPLGPQLPPLTYVECKKALHKIPMGAKSLAPVSFGGDPGKGFPVPESWDFGRCAVLIDVSHEGQMVRSTFAAIFKRAFDIAVECVIKPPHLGGRGLVGEDDQLKVSIYGIHPRTSSPSSLETA